MNVALIIAGGSGNRFGAGIPKQYSLIKGRPVIEYVIDTCRAAKSVDKIIVVTAEDYLERVKSEYQVETVRGGKERNHSVKCGIDYVAEHYDCEKLVTVDANTPIYTEEQINRFFELLDEYDHVITAMKVVSSLGRFDGKPVIRDDFFHILQPEGFRFSLLHRYFDGDYPSTTVWHQFPEGTNTYFCFEYPYMMKLTYPFDRDIAEALLDHIANKKKEKKVVLGLSNCVDRILKWDANIIVKLAEEYGIKTDDIQTEPRVRTERDLIRAALFHMKERTASEIFVENPEVIDAFSSRFCYTDVPGGSAVTAALTANVFGQSSTIHTVSTSDGIRQSFPSTIKTICSAVQDEDNLHIILQYPSKEKIKVNDIEFRTPRDNRVIFANDKPGEKMVLSKELVDEVKNADFVLVTGMNSVKDYAILDKRIEELKTILERVPEHSMVYFEDFCFHNHNRNFNRLAHMKLRHRLDVLSMNEDEFTDYFGQGVDFLNAQEVADALTEYAGYMQIRWIILHTQFWALAYGHSASSLSSGIRNGILAAATRYRVGTSFTMRDLIETSKETVDSCGVMFANEIERVLGSKVCCVPGYDIHVSGTPVTVGLGDAFVGGFIAGYTGKGIL